ncbi:hypothetical protein [Sodalis-like endosymbiont of Proechinophthirus fluctus]|uniref:hypothetical protein n=1 Tax=Sodalis-like endosymbiont of Proechinophthirus fluctus TaxID=1462730 RepID=UPI001FCA765F|nr:hypothetical protein [Sodalis-like endosymbiont of Proechinophthirus fluctus]
MSLMKTLVRGFSVTTDSHIVMVKQASQLGIGDRLTTRLSDGWVESQVTHITRQPAKRQRRSKD